MKNMKKTLLMILAMMLVCAISVAATIAYFVAETGSVTNTFTFGNVDISVEEDTPGDQPTKEDETYNYDQVKPGIFYTKAPTITNEGSEVAWVRMTVKYDADVASALGAPELTDLLKKDGASSISANWTYAGYYTDNGDKVYVYDYNSELAAEATTDALFSGFTVPATWDGTGLTAPAQGTPFTFITINGYAVQEAGLSHDDAKAAMAEKWTQFATLS